MAAEVWNDETEEDRLREIVDTLAVVLDAVEWEGPGNDVGRCPACLRTKREGHAPACALHAALVAAGRRG